MGWSLPGGDANISTSLWSCIACSPARMELKHLRRAGAPAVQVDRRALARGIGCDYRAAMHMAAAAVISELPRWRIIVEAIARVLWHLTPGRGHCAGAEITAQAPAADPSSAAWQAEPVVSGVSPMWARRAS